MNKPVTKTAAMEAMNSGVVSLGFCGLTARSARSAGGLLPSVEQLNQPSA